MESAEIYLDHSATTPLDPEVLEAMLPFLRQEYANASSTHLAGRRSRVAVEQARAQAAGLIGAESGRVLFTGGGSESDNLALVGYLQARDPHLAEGGRIVTSAIEHPAILRTCEWLAGLGYEIVYLPVDRQCRLSPGDLAAALTPDTRLVSLMLANNETGTLQPIAELARVAHEHGVPFHTDAVQAVGKAPVGVAELGVDLLSFTAHKLHGPKGVGALYVADGLELSPLIRGGKQEHNLRAGTENVAGIVGFGAAAAIAQRDFDDHVARLQQLRAVLLGVRDKLPLVMLNGHPELTLPQTVNLCFLNVDALDLQANLSQRGVAISVGSACASGTLEPSYVLKAMGLSDLAAASSVRFSMGRENTVEELQAVVPQVVEIVENLRWITSPEDIGVCDDNCPCRWEPGLTEGARG